MFKSNEHIDKKSIIYETKPSVIVYCKRIPLNILLIALLVNYITPIIQLVASLQDNYIELINMPITSIISVIAIVLMFFWLFRILWIALVWYNIEYTIYNTGVAIKKGVLFKKEYFMPFSQIQDINTSSGIIARILGAETIELYSAYDKSKMVLKSVSKRKGILDIIYDGINQYTPQNYQYPYPNQQYYGEPQHNNYNYTDYRQNQFYDYQDPNYIIPNHRDEDNYYNDNYNQNIHNQNNYKQHSPDEQYGKYFYNEQENLDYYINESMKDNKQYKNKPRENKPKYTNKQYTPHNNNYYHEEKNYNQKQTHTPGRPPVVKKHKKRDKKILDKHARKFQD